MNRIEISNLALNAIGARTIQSLTDESNKEAKTMNLLYRPTVDSVLSLHPWPSAIKRGRVAATADENLSKWEYVYRLPNDCISVLSMLSEDYFTELDRIPSTKINHISDDAIFEREGKFILSNVTPGIIKYIYFPEDAEQLRDIVGEAIAMRLAHRAALTLGRDASVTQMLEDQFTTTLILAKAAEGVDLRSDPIEQKDWSQYR